MFQVIDQGASVRAFGDSVLKFFMMREQQQLQQEELKIKQGQFKLEQEQAEAQNQQRADAGAAGQTLLSALASTEAGQVAGFTPDAIAGLSGGQAAALAPGAQQATTDVASISQGQERVDIARDTLTETVNYRNAVQAFDERKFEFTKEIERARLALTKASTEADIRSANANVGQFALKHAQTQFEQYLATAQALGASSENAEERQMAAINASLLIYGTARPPTQTTVAARTQELLSKLDDPADIAEIIAGPTPSDMGRSLGVDSRVIAIFEQEQTEQDVSSDATQLSDEEFLFEMFKAIDASNTIEDKEGQKARTTIWMRGLTKDASLGTSALFEPREKLTLGQRIRSLLRVQAVQR